MSVHNLMPSRDDVPQPSHAELLMRAANGDADAYADLFAFFAPRLKTFYLRRGLEGGAAEDLTQEAMLRVWRHAAQFDPARAAPGAWVFGIARNLRADMLRRQSQGPLELDLPEPYAPDDTPEAVVMQAQVALRLQAALNRLPESQQAAVRLAYLGDLTHKEAHHILGIALGTLKSRLRMALVRLRAAMDEQP